MSPISYESGIGRRDFFAVADRRFSAASSPHCWEALSRHERNQSPATYPRSTEPPFAW